MSDAKLPELAFKHPVFKGNNVAATKVKFPDPPPWRSFANTASSEAGTEKPREPWQERAAQHQSTDAQRNAVNLALHLHRPLLITGAPGTGKSSLAYAIAFELGLERPLVWAINSRSSLKEGMYQYDAVGRFKDKSKGDIGTFLRLGPLGAALASSMQEEPAVLLIDEIDKSDIDLPNDLLHALEEGRYEIPELQRLGGNISVGMPNGRDPIEVENGVIECRYFPIVLMTSNGERDFPAAFHRRCIRLNIDPPDVEELMKIVSARLKPKKAERYRALVTEFAEKRKSNTQTVLSTDQLLNAILLMEKHGLVVDFEAMKNLNVLRQLDQ